jgi:prepilin-type N-terminal cleavage/methylation domain-containing protein
MAFRTLPKAGVPGRGPRRAFTLVELLLATALLLLLLGAVVFSFSTLQAGAELEEGALQFENLLRFARAHAASTGRQVQIDFEEETPEGFSVPLGNCRVLWEPDPLGQPGQFEEVPEAAAYVRAIADLVSINSVQNEISDAPVQMPGEKAKASEAVSFMPISFYPDGSSDSAQILLAARNGDDERLVSVCLAGVTGAIRRHIMARDEKPSVQSETNAPPPSAISQEN